MTSTSDGAFALSANEGDLVYGEPAGERTDPAGSISVVDLRSGAATEPGCESRVATLDADGPKRNAAPSDGKGRKRRVKRLNVSETVAGICPGPPTAV